MSIEEELQNTLIKFQSGVNSLIVEYRSQKDKDAVTEEMRRLYRQALLQCHPDKANKELSEKEKEAFSTTTKQVNNLRDQFLAQLEIEKKHSNPKPNYQPSAASSSSQTSSGTSRSTFFSQKPEPKELDPLENLRSSPFFAVNSPQSSLSS